MQAFPRRTDGLIPEVVVTLGKINIAIRYAKGATRPMQPARVVPTLGVSCKTRDALFAGHAQEGSAAYVHGDAPD